MTAFEHLRLNKHKGLESAILDGLGKINVLCGPNNSGKSTIMESIADGELHTLGKTFTDSEIAQIAELSQAGYSWGSSLKKIYLANVKEAFVEQDIWFEDQCEAIRLQAMRNWHFNFGQYGEPTMAFHKAYGEYFAKPASVVLIPAKRRLELHVPFSLHMIADMQPDGSGVLGFLFSAKNKGDKSVARQRYDAIVSGFQAVTKGFEFEAFTDDLKAISLHFRKTGGDWLKADDCGIGLQEILLILCFSLASEFSVILIEEPENHLHPDIQRRLVAFLRDHSDKQYIISTHSSVFLNTQYVDRVFACRFTDSVQVENMTSKADLLTELGYSISDNLVSDLVILCEGPTDKHVLEAFLQKLGMSERYIIKIWPMGGDIMGQLDFSVFHQSYRVIVLMDNDPHSDHIRRKVVEKCGETGIPCHRLERYALENYFSIAAMKAVFKAQFPAAITSLDPARKVSEQLGIEVKKNNYKIAQQMTLGEIAGTDFEAFLELVRVIVSKPTSEKVA